MLEHSHSMGKTTVEANPSMREETEQGVGEILSVLNCLSALSHTGLMEWGRSQQTTCHCSIVILWLPFFKSDVTSQGLNCIQILASLLVTLETLEYWDWNPCGCCHYINWLALVIRKECQILLGVSSYQVIAMLFFLERALGKLVWLAEFLSGTPTSSLLFTLVLLAPCL